MSLADLGQIAWNERWSRSVTATLSNSCADSVVKRPIRQFVVSGGEAIKDLRQVGR